MSKYHELDLEDRRIIIIERDSNLPWAVAAMFMFIVIGFGIIVSMQYSSLTSVEVYQALKDKHQHDARNSAERQKISMNLSTKPDKTVVPVDEPCNVQIELPEIEKSGKSDRTEINDSETIPYVDSFSNKKQNEEEFQE